MHDLNCEELSTTLEVAEEEFHEHILSLSSKEIQEKFTIETNPSRPMPVSSITTVDIIYSLEEKRIGSASLIIENASCCNPYKFIKVLLWASFDPTSKCPYLSRSGSRETCCYNSPKVNNLGIGSLAHTLTLTELISREFINKEYSATHIFAGLSDARRLQLEAMHITTKLPLKDYLNKSIRFTSKYGYDIKNPLE